MLARQRHDIIVDVVQKEGSVRVRDLATVLGVSEMTVRRDLDTLAAQNLVEKVHGGAARFGNLGSFEPGFTEKQHRQQPEKKGIAAAAVRLIQPGSAIALTAGTTTWALAKLLGSVGPLTVVSNSPAIAQTLYQLARPELTVILTGGTRTPSDALVGPIACASVQQLHFDTLFMGVHGMAADVGFSTPNMAEAEMNAALVRNSRQVVVLADHTKWGVRGLARIAPLDRADTVVSDERLSAGAQSKLAEGDTRVILASTN